MIVLGQLKSGAHAGCWCLLAELDADTAEELAPEEAAKLAQARLDYAQVSLWTDAGAPIERAGEAEPAL